MHEKSYLELQRQVLATIGGLIEEYKEYADKGNYGNLHNIDFIRTKTLCQGGDVDVGLHGLVVGVAGPFQDELGRGEEVLRIRRMS